MLARHILTFLFALLFAACDAQSLFIHAGTTPGRKYENQEPKGPGSITCCRCSSAGLLIPSLSNELTEMRINISAPERFFIDVLDASGRIFTELGMYKLPAGSHRLPINTADLAVGTYACRVTGGTVRRARFVVQH